MYLIVIVIMLFKIIYEESNRNVLTPKQQKIMAMKHLTDREKQLHDDVFSGRIFKK